MAQVMVERMRRKDRDALRKNRVFLTELMQQLPVVAEYLHSEKILSTQMVEEMKTEGTREKQIATLLDILPKKGPRAFGCLVAALVHTRQDNIARGLDSKTATELIEKRQQLQRADTENKEAVESMTVNDDQPIEEVITVDEHVVMYLPVYISRSALNCNTLHLWGC